MALLRCTVATTGRLLLQQHVQPQQQGLAIGQLRDRIHVLQVADAALGLQQLGDVLADFQQVAQVAVRIGHRGDAHAFRDLHAILAAAVDHALPDLAALYGVLHLLALLLAQARLGQRGLTNDGAGCRPECSSNAWLA